MFADSERSNDMPPIYRVNVLYHTPDGEITAVCYARDVKSIPGWGLNPEDQSEQDAGAFVRLKEPFPVIV